MLDIHRELKGDRQDLPMPKFTIDTKFLRTIRILLYVRGSPRGGKDGEAGEGVVPVRAQRGGHNKGL